MKQNNDGNRRMNYSCRWMAIKFFDIIFVVIEPFLYKKQLIK